LPDTASENIDPILRSRLHDRAKVCDPWPSIDSVGAWCCRDAGRVFVVDDALRIVEVPWRQDSTGAAFA
jgi:hypothetical protein